MSNLSVVFFGTPDFAVESLQAIYKANYTIKAVVTAPDKPQGRGYKLTPSPVKAYAESVHLKVLQPTNLKDKAFTQELNDLNADVFVVVAFRMLPKAIWAMPPKGTFNLHASLLPNYRGAAPIHWAVINGETKTGVTTFFLQHEIDTGNIIQQIEVPISNTETTGELYNTLMKVGAPLVVKTLEAIENNTVKAIPQNQFNIETPKHAPKIFKEHCLIDWSKPGNTIYNLIRGMSPFPGAFTNILLKGESKIFKIYKCVYVSGGPQTSATTPPYFTEQNGGLAIQLSDGILELLEIQVAGKPKMSGKNLLNGYSLNDLELVFS